MGLADMGGCSGNECMDWDSAQAGTVMCYVNLMREDAAQVAESELWDHLQWSEFPNYHPTDKVAPQYYVVNAPVLWAGNPADVVDTGQILQESVVSTHERVCMDRLMGAWLEMVGDVGITCTVLDNYSGEMTMGGNVATGFQWMTVVVCCFLVTRFGEENCQYTSRMRPAWLEIVSELH